VLLHYGVIMYVGRIGEKRNAYQTYTSGEEKNSFESSIKTGQR